MAIVKRFLAAMPEDWVAAYADRSDDRADGGGDAAADPSRRSSCTRRRSMIELGAPAVGGGPVVRAIYGEWLEHVRHATASDTRTFIEPVPGVVLVHADDRGHNGHRRRGDHPGGRRRVLDLERRADPQHLALLRPRRGPCRRRAPLESRAVIYDKDADLTKLDGKTVAILGYGSQGHAHALNLKDSGVNVVVGLRPDSSSVAKAEADGLEVLSVADAASRGDMVMILLPDERQARHLGVRDRGRDRARATCCCSPTASRSTTTRSRPGPGVDVGMVAPKGPGPPGAAPVRRGERRARPDRHPPGRVRHAPATSSSPTPRASAAPARA